MTAAPPEPPTPQHIQARRRDVEALLQLAHRAALDGDAAAAGWRARTALEAMLQLRADVEGVEVHAPAGKPITVEVLRVALRHARLLSRRTEDHVAHVQNIGNRAAHGTVGPDQAVELDEAAAALVALDRVWRDLQPAVQPAHAQVPPAAPATFDRGAALLGLAVVAVSFVASFWTLRAWQGGADPAGTLPPPAVRAVVDAQGLEALLADTDPAPDTPFARVVAHVRDHQALRPDDLLPISCRELLWSRNWVWAARGYAFEGAEARAYFAADPAYVSWNGSPRREVERGFSEVDWANLDLLTETVLGRDCGCVRPGRKRLPCPE